MHRTDSVSAFMMFTVKQQRWATTGAVWEKHEKDEKGTQEESRGLGEQARQAHLS